MADLNWSNPKVITAVQNILRFWLDAGVDGFRLDVINFLNTDGITADNPIKDGKQIHQNDIDQSGVKTAMKIIKSTVNEYENRFIVGEIGSDKIEVLKQYQSEELLDVVFNFNFGSIPSFSSDKIFEELQSMESNMSNYPTLFFGSHDMPRMIDRLAHGDVKRAEALAALTLTAKGIPFIYYGEEIGMQNIIAEKFDEIKDVQGKTQYELAVKNGLKVDNALKLANDNNRDKSRSPMQWNDQKFAGFSNKKPWIKVNENYRINNVESLNAVKNSIIKNYSKLISIRNNEKSLQYGTYKYLKHADGEISFERKYKNENITVIVNFGSVKDVSIPANASILYGEKRMLSNSILIFKIISAN